MLSSSRGTLEFLLNVTGTGSSPPEAEGHCLMGQRQPGGVPRQCWWCLLCFLAPEWCLSWKQHPAGEARCGWTSRASLRELGERPGSYPNQSTAEQSSSLAWRTMNSILHGGMVLQGELRPTHTVVWGEF